MKIQKRLSLGGKVSLLHYTLFSLFFALPMLIAYPAAAKVNGDHWYWSLLDLCKICVRCLSRPISYFMTDLVHGGPFALWMNRTWIVPLLTILALNSFFIGYVLQFILSTVFRRNEIMRNFEA